MSSVIQDENMKVDEFFNEMVLTQKKSYFTINDPFYGLLQIIGNKGLQEVQSFDF